MSRVIITVGKCREAQPRRSFTEELIDFPSEIAFEATDNLPLGQTFCSTASNVSLSWLMPAHPDNDYPEKSSIWLDY
jgi:hypothetical protein